MGHLDVPGGFCPRVSSVCPREPSVGSRVTPTAILLRDLHCHTTKWTKSRRFVTGKVKPRCGSQKNESWMLGGREEGAKRRRWLQADEPRKRARRGTPSTCRAGSAGPPGPPLKAPGMRAVEQAFPIWRTESREPVPLNGEKTIFVCDELSLKSS